MDFAKRVLEHFLYLVWRGFFHSTGPCLLYFLSWLSCNKQCNKTLLQHFFNNSLEISHPPILQTSLVSEGYVLIKVSQVYSQNRCYLRTGSSYLQLLHQSSHAEGTTLVMRKEGLGVPCSFIKKVCPKTFSKQSTVESMDFIKWTCVPLRLVLSLKGPELSLWALFRLWWPLLAWNQSARTENFCLPLFAHWCIIIFPFHSHHRTIL